jgi:hypothetical protein
MTTTTDRSRILGLLSEGKISAEEAERLLDAVDEPTSSAEPESASEHLPLPKFLYVKVLSTDGDNVDVRVPISLVRSGLKLTSIIPPQAMDQINDSMAEHDMSIDFQNMKPEDIDELVEGLREMEVTVDSANGDNIRVWCE